ncbi:alpha-2-macroglobulin family protein [Chitinimonas sp. PSY-7]|uniref:alpha-2-macroglobulin family protein n=1 Tax=Chitinimonas sp. PSY-7 TaxID=3459088 RepID=UPI00403FCCC4
MRPRWLFICLPILVGAAELESFSPQGAVREVRQAKARFSEPMVRFGDPRLADPFDVTCGEEKGAGRWLDDRNWVYDFNRDLPAATQCQFRLKPNLKSLAGSSLSPASYSFSTGGPEPGAIWPENWQPIAEDQVFIVSFAAPPTPASLAAKTRCEVEGVRERIPAVIMPVAEREKLLAGYFGEDRKRWPANAEALRCQRPLPNEASLKLVFDAGLSAANGASLREPMEFEFHVRPRFTAWVSCERTREKADCLPLAPIELRFSEGVDAKLARQISLRSSDGKQSWAPELIFNDEGASDDSENAQLVSGVRFKPLFPESASLKLTLPDGVRDEYGRSLSNAGQFPQTVKVDTFPALAKFAADFGLVERSVGVLPVTVRNVGVATKAKDKPAPGFFDNLVDAAKTAMDSKPAGKSLGLPYRQLNVNREADILRWYQALKRGAQPAAGQDYRSGSLLKKVAAAQRYQLPTPNDDRAAEVIGLPLPKTGLTVVEVESERLGKRNLQPAAPMFVASGALVTNLGVHFRRGMDDALVWVTTLDKGWLVNNATVSVLDCKGKQLAAGKTNKQGVWQLNKALPAERYDCPLFAFARQGEDVSFVASNWDEGIEPWRFGLNTEHDRNQRRSYHAVLDRGLYRVGETVAMKLVAREKTASGFGFVPAGQLPNQVKLRHMGSDEDTVLPLVWRAGAAEISWKVPTEAKLGSYSIEMERKQGKQVNGLGEAGVLNVAEFRVPLMRGMVKLPSDTVAVNSIQAVAQVQYLAGGPAAGEAVKLRAVVRPAEHRQLDDFEGFTFANGDVSANVLKGGASGDEEVENPEADQVLEVKNAVLDKAGGATLVLDGWRKQSSPAWLNAELEYRDPNGEVQTSSTRTLLWPSAVQTGLKFGERKSQGGMSLELGVANLVGKPLSGRQVKAQAWSREVFSHRKRLVGGFYSYEHETRYQPLGDICSGKTDTRGRLACSFPAKFKGNVVVRVSSSDDAGHVAYAMNEVWLPGEGESWDSSNDGDRIDLIADKKQYEPGETATVRVVMPFREVTALVAVEREKVLEWRTVTLSAANPVIKLPIHPHYGPNVFVSVLAVRGRVAEPSATALLDLAKPAYKLGVIKLKVGSKDYGLDVKVTADKPLYQVRDKAKVKVVVKRVDGKPMAKGSEIALAAVDEGLLQLRANESWKLLPAMLGERGYGFYTATAQGQVIGKRHFGRKAVPIGGGGGRNGTRELFDTLLLWKGRVTLDANGEASVEIPLNDSLTSFRIVAVATSGSDRFGTGETSIRASKDVMLFNGLARTVREGDHFEAGFTVRNTTKDAVALTVKASAKGLPALPDQVISLGGDEAREIIWPVVTPTDIGKLDWTVMVQDNAGRQYDKLAFSQSVIPAVPVRVLQATITQLPPNLDLPLARPTDAIAGRGGVNVTLSPSLVAALDGVADYWRAYPYTCLEQQTSKALGLNDEASWKAIVARLDGYLDSDGLAKYFPTVERGSPVLTAHLLTLSAASGWELPDKGRERMKQALTAYVEGRLAREEFPSDSTHRASRKLDAIAALARWDAARPAMLDGLVLEPNRWSTATLLDWIAVLEKLTDLPKQPEKLKEARQILNARLDMSGTSLNFSTAVADDAWWSMDSADADAARILLDALTVKGNRADLGRLARGVVSRQQRGHWDTTVANAWGALALRRFAQEAEAGVPTGSTVAKLGNETRFDWAKSPKGGTLKLAWPEKPASLQLTHQGQGKPWAIVEARAAIPLRAPLNAGYRVEKRWEPVDAKGKTFARGEVWRARLTIDAQADMTWVAVNDPIPAGATLLGRGMATDSTILASKENREGAWPAFEEKGETAYRAYYDWLPKGRHVLEYTVRFNTRGEFPLPATRVEALYAPERFGETPNLPLKVE